MLVLKRNGRHPLCCHVIEVLSELITMSIPTLGELFKDRHKDL